MAEAQKQSGCCLCLCSASVGDGFVGVRRGGTAVMECDGKGRLLLEECIKGMALLECIGRMAVMECIIGTALLECIKGMAFLEEGVGEGRLLDEVHRLGTAFWRSAPKGRLLDGVRRLGTAFDGVHQGGMAFGWSASRRDGFWMECVG